MSRDLEHVDVRASPRRQPPQNLISGVRDPILLAFPHSMVLYAKQLPTGWQKMVATLNQRRVGRLRIELSEEP